MKILLTTDWYSPVINGVVTSVINLKRGLEERGHEVRVLTLSGTTKSSVEDGVTYIGSVSAGKIYPGARLRTAMAGRYVKELIAWKPDVVHSQCEFSTFFMAKKIAKYCNAPLVHTYHTVYEDYTHYFSPSIRMGKKAVAVFSDWVSDRVDCMIAPTEKVRDMLVGYNVSAPVHVVPTGIDTRKFSDSVSADQVDELRRSLKIPEGDIVAVSVSRLAEEKNIDEIISCFAKCGRLSATLVIAGDGPKRRQLEELAQELGVADRVRFVGMVSPQVVANYYRLGDLFVSGSTSETQGLTYIEALSSGVPLLCRADDCLDGIVSENVNGWQYHTPEEFCQRLTSFAEAAEAREIMSRAAEASSVDFSLEIFAARAEKIYRGCISARQSVSESTEIAPKHSATALIGGSATALLLCVLLYAYFFGTGIMTSIESLQSYVSSLGSFGVIGFIMLQVVQVVIPIVPGGLGCLAGVVLFGPLRGFLYNYIGICIGSIAAFAISKNCGRALLPRLFSPRVIERYSRWTEENNRFAKLFALAIFFPVAPDDFLCYLAGTTSISWKRYTAIILLGKPASIALYSMGLNMVWNRVIPLLAH